MEYKELNEVLTELHQAMIALEETYIENEGEVTEQTEKMEEAISCLKELVNTQGIDMLGAWLKSKEDKKKALKAEKDYITRQINATDESIEFIKAKIHDVMELTGEEKIKGTRGYSFTSTTSVKTEVDKDVLKSLYAQRIEDAIRAADVPDYIGVTLTASSTRANEVGLAFGDEAIFVTTRKPSVRFTKPRASKED